MRGLDDLDSQANAAAEDKQRKAFAADDARKELRAQEAAERKAEEARAAEQRQAQEQAKQLAATETAQREPLPKSVTQFDAHLDRTAKTERDATTRATDAAKAINRGAYQSRREDFTRYDGLTALHAANTPARIPAASHAFGALDLQSRQPPQPQLERAKSNSPFAPLPFAEKQYVAIRNTPDNSRVAQQPQKAESAPNDTMRAFAPLTPAQVASRDNAPAERKYLAVRDAQEGRSEGMSGDAKRFLAVRLLDNNGRPNGNGRGGPGR